MLVAGNLPAIGVLEPGRFLEFRWVAEESEALPGEYRIRFPGFFCIPQPLERAGPGSVELFAYFELVG